MKVILLDNIKGIGRIGDIKDVNDGYARNFLFPRKLAKVATDGAAKELEHMKAKKLEASSLAKEESAKLAETLKGASVLLQEKANEKGKLFSAITAKELAGELSKLANAHITPNAIELPEHIKSIGQHPIRLNLPGNITLDLTVEVIPVP